MDPEEDRIALFLDYENLAIGARDNLRGAVFDLSPVLDALAERGRVIARKAYADWSYFDEDRRMLTRAQVELVEIPQRMGASRKNAADLKLTVDALEMAFEREFVTTFVIGTGDSDFTPLVHKLRELNKRVIGVGIGGSTSAMLPPACDEFLFYESLEGVSVSTGRRRRGRGGERGQAAEAAATATEAPEDETPPAARSAEEVESLIARTVAGLQRSSGGSVLASSVKRALLRKDPTFSEADYGFRAFGELLRYLQERNVVELSQGTAKGDPEVSLPSMGEEPEAFAVLRTVVQDLQSDGVPVQLSGLKDQVRKARPGFSEKKYGYGGFLQFCKAAETQGFVSLEWDAESEDYLLTAST